MTDPSSTDGNNPGRRPFIDPQSADEFRRAAADLFNEARVEGRRQESRAVPRPTPPEGSEPPEVVGWPVIESRPSKPASAVPVPGVFLTEKREDEDGEFTFDPGFPIPSVQPEPAPPAEAKSNTALRPVVFRRSPRQPVAAPLPDVPLAGGGAAAPLPPTGNETAPPGSALFLTPGMEVTPFVPPEPAEKPAPAAPPKMNHPGGSPTDQFRVPAMPESGGDEDDESADELWEPSERPGWFVRWRSGWRLALILAVIVGGYAGWRGQRDYQSFKSWRARSMAEEALRLANDHNAAGAQELLDRAAVLDPKDPEVMRAIVKFCEPRQDFMALYALRQLILTGAAEPEEWELLCRLSFEWGRPELAPPTLLSAWATSAVESLTPGQVLLSCQWLAGRGRLADAEKRLREKVAAGGPGQAKLRIALSNILLGSMEGNSDELKHRAEEGLTTLRQVSTDANVPPAERADAARMLASYLLLPANRGMLRGEAASLLIQTFKSLAVAEPASALKHDLAAASVSLAADPSTGGKILEELLRRASSLPLPDRLTLGRWMVDQRMLQEMLILAATLPESETDDDWVKLRLDALLALNKHDDVSALLAANGSPLPPLTREVYRYRLAKKLKTAAKPDEVLQTARDGAQPKVVMDAARAMEGMQEYDAAAQLYRAVQNDERVGLSAKLAIVRCLSALPSDDAGPLIEALDSVLRAWPQMDDARNDMIYLKLVANTATPEEMRDAGLLAKNYPWMLAYRVTAALAEFRNNNAPGALALLEQEKLPWDRVPPGWQSIYGVLLAANHRIDEARAIGVRIMGAKLRTGEAKLLRQYLPDSP